MRTIKEERGLRLSKVLVQKRHLLKISLEELSQKISVSGRYLRKIEQGDWGSLPPSVYTKGFLKKYAIAVGTNPDEIIRRYEEEIGGDNIPTSLAKKEKGFFSRIKGNFSLSPRVLRLGGLTIVIVFILGYIAYQFSAVLALPNLDLIYPATEELVVGEDSIIFRGQIEKGVGVFINSEQVKVASNGSFEKQIELLLGLNSFEVRAVSRFNKETSLIRRVIYNP